MLFQYIVQTVVVVLVINYKLSYFRFTQAIDDHSSNQLLYMTEEVIY